MILNRIELGTPCTIRKNGETGKVSKIFFYPTKYEVEFPIQKELYKPLLDKNSTYHSPIEKCYRIHPKESSHQSF